MVEGHHYLSYYIFALSVEFYAPKSSCFGSYTEKQSNYNTIEETLQMIVTYTLDVPGRHSETSALKNSIVSITPECHLDNIESSRLAVLRNQLF